MAAGKLSPGLCGLVLLLISCSDDPQSLAMQDGGTEGGVPVQDGSRGDGKASGTDGWWSTHPELAGIDAIDTPASRFENIAEFDFEHDCLDVQGIEVCWIDEGPREAEAVLLMHGEPTWSYLYRKMAPVFLDAGYRVVAPDNVGFGRSSKPTRRSDYTYARLVKWNLAVIDYLGLQNITLVGQDWGGLIGFRLAAENPDRFVRLVATNTSLPTGDPELPVTFFETVSAGTSNIPGMIQGGTVESHPPEALEPYSAPYPDESYKAGAQELPFLVPRMPDMPGAAENRAAWEVLSAWEKPVLVAFGDADFQSPDPWLAIPGAEGQPHRTIAGAGHFIQEDKGVELAELIVEFMQDTPL